MKFGWETERERVLRRAKIAPEAKLEGIRLMNEFIDRALTLWQKIIRRNLRQTQK